MAKFKVGDKVRFTDMCSRGWWFGPHTRFKDGVIIKDNTAAYKYTVECSGSKHAYVDDGHIELVTEPTRFKVGDRVVHKHYGAGTVKKDDKTSIPYLVFFDRGANDGWQFESELTPENTTKTTETPKAATTTPERQSIVALIEHGQPKPSHRPYVHATTDAATKEAERLAAKYPGQKFGVYQLVTARIGTVSVAEA